MRWILIFVVCGMLVGCGSSEGGPRVAGQVCDATADCVSGLECLPLGQFDGSTCTVVATVCTHLCTVDADCADLGTDYLCFEMCDGRRSCVRTG